MRKFLFLVLSILSLGASSALNAAVLTVRVSDTAGSPVSGALVAAIAFNNQVGGTGEPDGAKSAIGETGASGSIDLTIVENYDYMLFVSKQGMSPSIKDQMSNPIYAPVRTSAANISANRVLSTDNSLTTLSGEIDVSANFPSGTMIFCDVRNITTDEPVAFSANKTPGAVKIFNVPSAAAGTYRVFVGVPESGIGYAVDSVAAVTAGQAVSISVSSTSFAGVGKVDRQDQPAGNISFESVVKDQNGNGLKDCVVVLKKKNPLNLSSYEWDRAEDYREVRTDFSGHFAFYDVAVDSYAVQISKDGYEGRFITGRYGALRPDRLEDRQITDSYDAGQVVLPPAKGRLKGRAKIFTGTGYINAPNTHVNVWPDWSLWPAIATSSRTSDAGGYNNYYTTGQDRAARGNAFANTDAAGNFEITGLSAGNYNMQIWSEFVNIPGGYSVNKGAPQGDSWSWDRVSTDLRITVTTGAANADWVCDIYDSSGAAVRQDLWSNPLEVCIATQAAQSGLISGTITFDVPGESVVISSMDAIMIFAYEQNTGGWEQMRFFTAITGTVSRQVTYSIGVMPEKKYWVELRSRNWGVVDRMDTNADLTGKTALTGLNFKLVPSGTVKGIVRQPDGNIFKKKSGQGFEERIELNAQGINTKSWGWGEVNDKGNFEISGLAPGLYRIDTKNGKYTFSTTSGQTGSPLEWPDTWVDGVRVKAGSETYLEIQLKNGALVSPKTPSLPPVAAAPAPYQKPYTQYGIIKFSSSEGATRDAFAQFMGGPEGFERSVAFKYDQSSSDPWDGARRILPGRYDFYLSRVDLFTAGNKDTFMQPNAHFCVTFISNLKNVEINYDALKPNATSYLEFESGTLGQSVLTGKVKGGEMFTQEDVDIIVRSGMDKFLTYIPSVMLYDSEGQLKAYSMALPTTERIFEWDKRINENSFTLEWFKKELADYPIIYRIERLPAGNYVAVFETPNSPPMMKKVVLASGENQFDVDFDSNSIIGSSVNGVVVSTGGVPLTDAVISLVHRTITKSITTDANGEFKISGLPPGTYRMTVNKAGYAPAAEKFGLGRNPKRFTGDDAIIMTAADTSIEGTVFSQKIPSTKVIVGAKVVAYNETYNTTNPSKMLPVLSAKTDEQGKYFIDGMISGNIYKVYVLSPGKLLEWKTLGTTLNPLPAGANRNVDFLLRSLPPRMKITMSKIFENNRFLYKFFVESPKKIINPSNPSSLAAPYCRYSPVDGADGSFVEARAVEVLPNIGPEISNPDGGKIYTYSLKIPVMDDSEYYKLRVQATDGSVDFSEDLLFGPKIEAKAKKDIKEELAEGGDISLDDTGFDTTQITVDPGALTPTGEETSNMVQNGVDVPIGGFLSAMPNFNLSRTGTAKSVAMSKIVDSIVASDVYEINLAAAQINKSLSLNLKFDYDKVNDAEMADLSIYQYNSFSEQWEVVPGAVTVDPISGVVSVDVDSVQKAANGSNAPAAGRSVIRNGMYAVNRAASTDQSGVFAVFKQDPATAKAYTGAEFEVYNFPNPFNLKSKNIHMTDVYSAADQAVSGTMIKYALPAAMGGRIKFYIYNLAAEFVRELDEGTKDGGYYYYTEWDGKNDNGEECASGVYFLLAKSDGKKINAKPLKMAILK